MRTQGLSGLARHWMGVLSICACAAGAVSGGEYTKTTTSTRLYTPADPAAQGGIQGTIAMPTKPILGIFAVAQQDQGLVYRGVVGKYGASFTFTNLPVGKYDLLVQYPDDFYEGLMLLRGDDTLTPRDHKQIEDIIMASIPFFIVKKIHRCLGVTGKEGKASAVLQEVRTRPVTLQDGSEHAEIQIRSIKLAMLEYVGEPGWALANTREMIRTEVAPSDVKGVLPHHFCPALNSIRVVDSVKELSDLTLK